MARTIYAWLLLLLVQFYFHHSLVHQWQQPLLIYTEADNVYWILHLLNIPQFIMRSSTTSLLFDIVMVGSVMLFLIFPQKNIYALISIICLWLFQVMFGSANGHHYHHIGFLLVPIPFLFIDKIKFQLSWSLIRYWILFLFLCSALYKFYYGGFFNQMNMSIILREAYYQDETYRSQVILYLVEHPPVAQLFYQAATFLQLTCIIGFITTKYDRLLLFLLFMFNVVNYYLLNFPFWENILVLAPFLPWRRIFFYVNHEKNKILKKRKDRFIQA